MDEIERRVLTALRLDWAPTPDEVWRPPAAHVAELNAPVLDGVLDAFEQLRADPMAAPTALVVTGQQGAGKTHLLGAVRIEVQRSAGFFFLLSLAPRNGFWPNIVHAVLSGLDIPGPDGRPQLNSVLERLADRLELPEELHRQVVEGTGLRRDTLDEVCRRLRIVDPMHGREYRQTLRALVLSGAQAESAQEIGDSYLHSASEAVAGERSEWGIHPEAPPPQQVVNGLSRLLALAGPCVFAIDQVDTLISQSDRATDAAAPGAVSSRERLLDEMGNGLMELRETIHRTVLVLACQPQVWQGIRDHAPRAAQDRFRRELRLMGVQDPEVGRALVAARFEPVFKANDFVPPYPTWPVRPEAFETAGFSPRELLKRIDRHIESCLTSGSLVELTDLDAAEPAPVAQPRVSTPTVAADDDVLALLDSKFDDCLAMAEIERLMDKESEDREVPPTLNTALWCYVRELGGDHGRYGIEWGFADDPALHARLSLADEQDPDDQTHWCFRAIGGSNAQKAQRRIDRIQAMAFGPGLLNRHAYVLRTGNWPIDTRVSREKLDAFRTAGGVLIEEVDPEDLRIFVALGHLRRQLGEASDDLAAWLRSRRPAGHTALFRTVFGEPEPLPQASDPEPPPREPTASNEASHPTRFEWPTEDPDGSARPDAPAAAAFSTDTLSLGTRADTGEPLIVALESLRKHTAIFAGSGSGKTVLLRRLIEECALRGVSSIVLDPNNDLARLGDAWPQQPATWAADDPARAADYLANTDVVVWTPRMERGRPLSFQPLPDLAEVLSDPDEFKQALDTAVAALAPRARIDGATRKNDRYRAVLREALTAFTQAGRSGLRDFVDYLAELPEDATSLAGADVLAADLAQTLQAAMINDPLFGGAGTPLDPAVLMTPAPGRRARVSVISLVGLPTDELRRSFVNQLQMALFAWVKRNPANDRPLGGLFVMDEAQTLAPANQVTACTESTLALTAQARKYGLGLVFATQAPKGIHNRIVGNAATQYFGFINSPTQVAAAKEIAAAKSSALLDISRLTAGEFYVATEGTPFHKVNSAMCLSHHPPSPLAPEEVMSRALAGVEQQQNEE
ncbi:helicase HerA domain-containing protein [Actinoalloteichus hymeniacidonis]|uniref:ATPase n=1 Tax=Actinoalloteichus hymeniacidonis TaxID=340345 RepID=A0AAC9HSL0_9PSEU|nr:DUF87 domain-containing protein [Actinoalloteichus hymeniacidonis]AOS64600.1 putative ATPase [Actinoalloteichus hymeniacidonis]MBB5907327.1 hypothetical protein [Actinoalloteichus hymeniacidonis]